MLHGPNLWPDQLPDFSTALRAYIDACLTLGEQLLRGIALGVGLPEAYFGGQLAGPAGSYWVARVIHYPPLQQVGQQQAGACGDWLGLLCSWWGCGAGQAEPYVQGMPAACT